VSAKARVRAVLRPTVHALRARFDDPEIRQARLLVKQCRNAGLRVVQLGASESIYISPDDADLRALPRMIAERLGRAGGYWPVIGAGYQPRLFEAYLRLVEPLLAEPPVLILGIPVRIGFAQWYEHPRYSYVHTIERVRGLRPGGNPALMLRRPPRISPAEMQEYDAKPLPSFLGEHPRGYYRRMLRHPRTHGLSDDEAARLRYAFYWGGVDGVVAPWLADLEALGSYLRDKGHPVVPYHMPIPFGQGNRFWPGYGDFIRPNLDHLEKAFRNGYGDVDFVQAGLSMPESWFIDPTDASEHVRDSGRLALAHEIAQRVEALT
jgi:hypothetical protein